MKLILALGNPGGRYADTRHNVGWWLADRLVRGWNCTAFARSGDSPSAVSAGRFRTRDVEIHKPLTYMNRSGEVLEPLGVDTRVRREDLLVLVDDIALPPGVVRLRARGSAGGHNGLASIADSLGEDRYPRLRLGVGRPSHREIDLAAWVLAAPGAAEEESIAAGVARAQDVVEAWVIHGIDAAMSRGNEPNDNTGVTARG